MTCPAPVGRDGPGAPPDAGPAGGTPPSGRGARPGRHALTIGIAAAGAVAFLALGAPIPLLLGPMAACLLAALAGVPMAAHAGFGTLMRTFIGVAVGSSVTPAFLGQVPGMALSLAFVPLYVAVIAATAYPLFRHVFGMDHPTAWYAAMPGGLTDMLIFGAEAGANLRALSLIHATRVLVLVSVAPLFMTWVWGIDLTRPPGQPAGTMRAQDLVLIGVAGLAGWRIAARLGLFGASVLGPMALAMAFSLSGLLHQRPPAELMWASQFFVGIMVGAKYTGVTLRELRTAVAAGLANTVLLGLVSIAFFEVLALSRIAPDPVAAFLAFLPGGQAEMVLIAIIAHADLPYVVAHHLSRTFLLILTAPYADRLFRRRG